MQLWHLPLTYNVHLPHELCDRHGDILADFRAFADGHCQHTPSDAQRCKEAMRRINVHDDLLAAAKDMLDYIRTYGPKRYPGEHTKWEAAIAKAAPLEKGE